MAWDVGQHETPAIEAELVRRASLRARISTVRMQSLVRYPYNRNVIRAAPQGFFVVQLMKKTGAKADPKLANQIFNQKLKG